MRIRLKELRKEKGWTQQEAAQELGISIDMVKAIENKQNFSSKKTLSRIYQVFDCKSMDDVIEHAAS